MTYRLLLYVVSVVIFVATRPIACVRAPTPRLIDGGASMANVTAMRGDTVEFRCRVQNLGKHMIAFFRDEVVPRLIAFDESIFRHHDKYELKARINSDEWVLRIKDVQETDMGGYICQLNTNPATSITGYLDIKMPPAVSRSSTPSAVEVPEGHNVTLSCHADGNPPPTVIWRRSDRQIIRYNGANGYGDSVYKGADLRLTRVSRKHMSEYVCVASNGIPPDESWTIKLHVLFEPLVIPQATVVEVIVGAPAARLVCNVEAWPRPHVTWLFNDAELYDSNRYSTEQSVVDRYCSLHILEVRDVSPDQFGRYRCVAANDYGQHFADIQLIEVTQPQTSALSEANANHGREETENGSNDWKEGDDREKAEESEEDEFYWVPKIDRAGRTALIFASATDRRGAGLNATDDRRLAERVENELTRAVVEDNKRFIDYYRELRHRKNVRTEGSEKNEVGSITADKAASISAASTLSNRAGPATAVAIIISQMISLRIRA